MVTVYFGHRPASLKRGHIMQMLIITNNFQTKPNMAYGHVTSTGTIPHDYDYVDM